MMRLPRAEVFLAIVLFASLLVVAESSVNRIHFLDTAAQAGIHAQLVCGSLEKKEWITEANGSGAAWLDYDRDGWMDLLIVNGSTMEHLLGTVSGSAPSTASTGVYLYRNLGNDRFQDVTSKSGLRNPYWGTGANAADYNNDGNTDILVTTIGVDLLFRNNGDGTFSEVGKEAGLSQTFAWHTGSAFGDYDGDSYLDLYVAGYVDIRSLPLTQPAPICKYKTYLRIFCGPMGMKGERDILYRNNGDGTFSEVTRSAGVEDEGRFPGFAAVFQDFNGDGKIDLFVTNDSDPNYLYLNLGNGKFQESALAAGVALNANGSAQSDMGVAVGDYDNDGRVDLLTTTFEDDYNPLFKQGHSGFFEEISYRTRLGTTTFPYLGWGCGFDDLDNDGTKELWLANGHVYPNVDRIPNRSYFQPFLVFRQQAGKFVQVWSFPAKPEDSYRSAAGGDFNNDGKVDIVLLPISGSPVLLTNQTDTKHSWIGLELRGRRSNRDAIGAQVQVEACGQTQYEWVRNGAGYLSRNDPRLHFGLGGCTKVTQVKVTWPEGTVQVLSDPPVNQYLAVEEPVAPSPNPAAVTAGSSMGLRSKSPRDRKTGFTWFALKIPPTSRVPLL